MGFIGGKAGGDFAAGRGATQWQRTHPSRDVNAIVFRRLRSRAGKVLAHREIRRASLAPSASSSHPRAILEPAPSPGKRRLVPEGPAMKDEPHAPTGSRSRPTFTRARLPRDDAAPRTSVVKWICP
jgi:hypothetical protein